MNKASAEARLVQARLLAVSVDDWGTDDDVPAATQKDIREFKRALAETVDAAMQCAPVTPEGVILAAANANAILSLHAKRPHMEPPGENDARKVVPGLFGSGVVIKARILRSQPLVTTAVEVRFDIPCGTDSLLAVYEDRAGRWRRTLLWQSPEYDTIGGAFGDFFEYQMLSGSKEDDWSLAIAHGHPWCTSRWSGFDLDVLRPGQRDRAPEVLMHRNDGYVRDDFEPSMKLVPGGFELRMEVGDLDGDIMTRKGIYRYAVDGNQVTRVQPIAMNGRDFVDEWLTIPWKDALRWSEATKAQELEKEHRRVSDVQHLYEQKTDISGSLTFGPVQRCSDTPEHFQVELNLAKWVHQDLVPVATTYFQIEQGKNSFKMLAASDTSDQRCGGGDLMKGQ